MCSNNTLAHRRLSPAHIPENVLYKSWKMWHRVIGDVFKAFIKWKSPDMQRVRRGDEVHLRWFRRCVAGGMSYGEAKRRRLASVKQIGTRPPSLFPQVFAVNHKCWPEEVTLNQTRVHPFSTPNIKLIKEQQICYLQLIERIQAMWNQRDVLWAGMGSNWDAIHSCVFMRYLWADWRYAHVSLMFEFQEHMRFTGTNTIAPPQPRIVGGRSQTNSRFWNI